MEMEQNMTAKDRFIAEVLRAETTTWSAECPGIDDMMDLAEAGSEHPNASRMREHLSVCAYCRREYAALVKDFRLAESIQEAKKIRERIFASATTNTPLSKRSSTLQLSWGSLAASTIPTNEEKVQVFCEGTLRVTLSLKEGQVILLAENHPDGLWYLDEQNHPQKKPGVGISLAGELVRFDLTTPEGGQHGYFVLPLVAGLSKAKIVLGSYNQLHSSQLECRLASPEELTDPEEVRASIARARLQSTQKAWVEFAQRHVNILQKSVIEVVHKAVYSM
jgi:hypothetical protein